MRLLSIATLVIAGVAMSAVAFGHDRDKDEDGLHKMVIRVPMMDFAFAGGPMGWIGASAAHQWDELDTDEDGRISRDEYMSAKEVRFEELDSDQDGYVDEDELEDFIEAKMEMRMEAMSERMEGRQFVFRGDRRMMEMDMEELENEIEEAMDKVEIIVERMAGPRMFFLSERDGRCFEGLDENDDGEITREEFMARRDKAFDRLDEDGDGIISEEEMEKGAENFRGDRMSGPRNFRYRTN